MIDKDFTYSDFQKTAGLVEGKFGGSRNLRLSHLDLEILRSDKFLNFGSGPSLMGFSKNETRIDSDREVNPDFLSINDVPESERFDSVYANQVFEHIEKKDIFNVVHEISKRMSSGGRIVATIPNINNWSQYVNNLDHKTPLSFYALGAFFELAGIEIVDSYRYTKRPHEIIQASDQEKYLFEFLSKYFEMDPAQFIAVVGKKRGEL